MSPLPVQPARRHRAVPSGLVPALALTLALVTGGCSAVHDGGPAAPGAGAEPRASCTAVGDHLPATAGSYELVAAETPSVYGEDDLWEHLNGGSYEVIRLGFDCLLVARYAEPATGRRITVESFRMASPEAAAASLASWAPEAEPTDDACGRWATSGRRRFLQRGAWFVVLIAEFHDEDATAALAGAGAELCPVLPP